MTYIAGYEQMMLLSPPPSLSRTLARARHTSLQYYYSR